MTLGIIAECSGDTSPGSLLNGSEKSLLPVGDWLMPDSGVFGAEDDVGRWSFNLSRSLALVLADSFGI